MNLRTLTYEDAARELADKSDEELLTVFAGESRKLGDTAFDVISRRNRVDLVIRALAEKKLTRRNGKVRGLNFLLSRGRNLPEAFPIYRLYAEDRSADVVDCALFGLAFWQDESVIPFLESLLRSKHADLVQKAIDALRGRNPKKYSPSFYDSRGVWKKG